MNAIFCSPLRYTQGYAATESLGAEMKVLGLSGPVLIVTSRSPRKVLEAIWRKTLAGSGFEMSLHEIAGECTRAEIGRIVDAARNAKCATILGAGGGKVLDAARAAAAQLRLPLISCPTIASTDSPCSAISVLYN
jgi:glycerol dehydrogenase